MQKLSKTTSQPIRSEFVGKTTPCEKFSDSLSGTRIQTDIHPACFHRQLTTRPAAVDTDGTPLAVGEFATAARAAIRSADGRDSEIHPVNWSVHVNASEIDA